MTDKKRCGGGHKIYLCCHADDYKIYARAGGTDHLCDRELGSWVKVEVAVQGSPYVPSNSPYGLCGRKATHTPSIAFRHLPKEFEGNTELQNEGPAELKKSCMHKGEVAQELCESRGGRPGLPVSIVCTVSVDVRQHTLRA